MISENRALFQPGTIGKLKISNRFIASSISYRDADQYGFPSDSEQDHIRRLARGRVGLIIPGYMYTSKSGRTRIWQLGMSSSVHADAWKDVIDDVHKLGSKIILQIAHGGIASSTELIKGVPKGPSAIIPKTQQMTIADIEQVIQSYVKAAKRLMQAGADGIEIQCGHGFLLSQFLSPFLNKRHDGYGGSIANRARIVKEIVEEIRKVKTYDEFAIIAKINGDDSIKKGGMTPSMCGQTVNILSKAGVDLFEITSGLISPWNIIRGKRKEDFEDFDHPLFHQHLRGNYMDTDFVEGYNVESLKKIREMNPNASFSVVGGHRHLEKMEDLVKNQITDYVSLGRPLLKDPFLVERFYSGKATESDCDNCNICYMNPPYMSVHCPKSQVLPLV
ncbi:NADPH dehydrogenase [Tritrichomonas foetus]|uniref:NADPH dehydrogenase n=1 Tax=Tritrichomonas foetus TaxID=1144522 RepID=A0A1J4JU75_9EUKA|nr:NADPH dehydrogenase [Tritrichomonas foetus]|eukprot:OHT02703.1 NADPH dehydrogenase [Tritrichomonas foetus]